MNRNLIYICYFLFLDPESSPSSSDHHQPPEDSIIPQQDDPRYDMTGVSPEEKIAMAIQIIQHQNYNISVNKKIDEKDIHKTINETDNLKIRLDWCEFSAKCRQEQMNKMNFFLQQSRKERQKEENQQQRIAQQRIDHITSQLQKIKQDPPQPHPQQPYPQQPHPQQPSPQSTPKPRMQVLRESEEDAEFSPWGGGLLEYKTEFSFNDCSTPEVPEEEEESCHESSPEVSEDKKFFLTNDDKKLIAREILLLDNFALGEITTEAIENKILTSSNLMHELDKKRRNEKSFV